MRVREEGRGRRTWERSEEGSGREGRGKREHREAEGEHRGYLRDGWQMAVVGRYLVWLWCAVVCCGVLWSAVLWSAVVCCGVLWYVSELCGVNLMDKKTREVKGASSPSSSSLSRYCTLQY